MKTAIFIQDGKQQIILQPDNDYERNIFASIENKKSTVKFKHGEFYGCQGGWTRFSEHPSKDSFMMIIEPKEKDEKAE